jgi:hypothetical protein
MNLQLSLKTKWFEMTKSGIKTEDYREINEYWFVRLFEDVDKELMPEIIKRLKIGWDIDNIGIHFLHYPKRFQVNTLTLGYPKSTDKERILKLEHKGIEIRTGNPEWGAEPNKLYFVIKHGEIKK